MSSKAPVPYAIVDAFTDEPFRGNPAAVVFLDGPRPRNEQWMQQVAAEFNLSETAFVAPASAGGYSLRWFTPKVEVDLCGHATLAAAHALWETGRLTRFKEAVFDTRSGTLACRSDRDGIAMDFPANPPTECEAPDGLLEGLGLTSAAWVGRCAFDYLVVLDEAEDVESLAPDYGRLSDVQARGIAVTAGGGFAGDGETSTDDVLFDFVSRFFAPRAGVDEDPVTGSAHTMMGPYWADRLGLDNVRGRQISARGGIVEVAVHGNRVSLRGGAVTVARGELLV